MTVRDVLAAIWPWGEIRRLRGEVERIEHRETCWRTAYRAVHADYTASLDRLGNEAGPAKMPGSRLVPVAAFGETP